MTSFEFNNKKIYEYLGFEIASIEIEDPIPNIVTESVPYMNGSYDFSNLYGPVTYEDRIIRVRIRPYDQTITRRELLYDRYSKLSMWLLSANRSKLKLDYINGYFVGRCSKISSIELFKLLGYIDIEFKCYPFRYMDNLEGDILWDNFNFELDVLQETKFDINGVKNVKIHNVGATNVVPQVICSNQMEVTKDNVTYKFNSGASKDYVFELGIGQNDMTIKGNGTIEFKFRKEVL